MINYFRRFLIIWLFVVLYRLFVLCTSNVDLFFDEAYYWYWSKNLDFGYYSKPPMVAWGIYIFTNLCGDSVFCIKLPALVMHSLTSFLVFFIAKELFNNEKISFYSGISYLTLPLISFLSLAITTDAFLLFFWALTLLFFIKALKTNYTIYWILTGISGGLGLLSKYTMILFLFSALLYLFFSKNRWVFKSKNFYLSILIAFLIFLPNLIWQFNHDFVSFQHTKEISEIDRDLFHFNKLLEFLAAQFGVFGPIFFVIFLYLLFKPFLKNDNFKLLYFFSYTTFLFILFIAFISRAFANWAAPSYVAGTILVVSYLIDQKKIKLIKLSIVINIIMAVIFYNYHNITSFIRVTLTSKIDPYKRVLGWKELSLKLRKVIQQYPNGVILYDDRKTMSEMVYYLRDLPNQYVMYNYTGKYRSQFDLDTNITKIKNKSFLYISQHPKVNILKKEFKSIKFIKKINLPLYKDFNRTYYIYILN